MQIAKWTYQRLDIIMIETEGQTDRQKQIKIKNETDIKGFPTKRQGQQCTQN